MLGFKEGYWIGYSGFWKRPISEYKDMQIGFRRIGKSNWVVWDFSYGYAKRAIVLFPFLVTPATKAMRNDWRWNNQNGRSK
jgi:hypothetical protein